MMGCYGDAQHKQEINYEIVVKLFTNRSTAFMANIILKVWEVENMDSSMKQRQLLHKLHNFTGDGSISAEMHHNDRSACSCLKDFASHHVVDFASANKLKIRDDPEIQWYMS